jgi:NADH-quinone oxidoreductase subunit E
MIDTQNTTIDKDLIEFIEHCLTLEHPESYLIAVLHKIQGRYGYISEQHIDEVAHWLQVPTSTVYGVVTFYHFFRTKPCGKFNIQICIGTACFVKGANQVLESFQNELGIELGETSSDGNFSLEGARCIGVCALAPVVVINEEVFSNVKPTQVSDILNKLRSKKVEVN